MNRGNSNGNNWNPGSPFMPGESPFRSPRPMYQSSPRYTQQFNYRSPHPGNWSPNSQHGQFGPSPNSRSFESSGNNNRSFNSPRSPYKSDSYRGRGGYSPNYGNQRTDRDNNPGGSDNIALYYHPSMLQDPWAGLSANGANKSS